MFAFCDWADNSYLFTSLHKIAVQIWSLLVVNSSYFQDFLQLLKFDKEKEKYWNYTLIGYCGVSWDTGQVGTLCHLFFLKFFYNHLKSMYRALLYVIWKIISWIFRKLQFFDFHIYISTSFWGYKLLKKIEKINW